MSVKLFHGNIGFMKNWFQDWHQALPRLVLSRKAGRTSFQPFDHGQLNLVLAGEIVVDKIKKNS